MSYFEPYNPNPCGCRVGDCTVRAICKATGLPWEQVYCALSAYGLAAKDLPSANHVWGRFLYDRGYRRHLIDRIDTTVADFCREHPKGTYILAIEGHVVCVQDGFYYDSLKSQGNSEKILAFSSSECYYLYDMQKRRTGCPVSWAFP